MTPDKRERPTYYAVLPAVVRYDEGLVFGARLLYAEISALTNRDGYCWASNHYFAELYKVDESTVSGWVSQLSDAGHVIVQVARGEGNSRKIWLTVAGGGHRKKPERVTGKSRQPSPEKAGGINLNEQTELNKEPAPAVQDVPLTDRCVTDAFWELYQQRCGVKPAYKAQYTKWRAKIWASSGRNAVLVRACVADYFNGKYFFTRDRTYSFDAFFQHWNEILSHVAAERRMRPPLAGDQPKSLFETVMEKKTNEEYLAQIKRTVS